MEKNFTIRMSGYETVSTDVEGAVEIIKGLWEKHPSNAIYVNDMAVRLEKENGKWGVILRDNEFNLVAGYMMGKNKRDMDKAIADVLDRGIKEYNINNMEENDMVNGYEVEKVNFNGFEMNMVDMTKMEKKKFTCDDAVKQIDALIDFVKEEGEGLSIRDVKNIIESVDRIYENVQKSDDIDSKTKDNFWYWDKQLRGINDIVYRLESDLFNIKDILE